jgi:RNA polymerase sigma-70 factor, ECF subfamily
VLRASVERGPASASLSSTILSPEEAALLQRLRRGDEDAFAALVEMYGASLLRVSQLFVSSRAVAEEVVQETWLGLLKGLDRFEGRSSLKTWLFRILANIARTRAVREARTVPLSSLGGPEEDAPLVDPSRFFDSKHRWAGHWVSFPPRWDDMPEERLVSRETRSVIEKAIAELPPVQQAVIALRDVEGWDSAEVCELLGLSEGNQRVLLHRARTRVRAALEDHLAAADEAA